MTKVVVLAGGFGTRLMEETEVIPKPMVAIGGQPILWHIMKHYAHHGFKDFVIALGYKGAVIKRYFLDYSSSFADDLVVDLATGTVEARGKPSEDWRVHLVDTGLETLTGGRLKRLERALAGGTFLLTYGDGVSDVDLGALVRFHRQHGKIATVTAVRPPARYGGLVIDESNAVPQFTEKPQAGEGWINGGFLVFEPGIFRYLGQGDQASLESTALAALAADGQLMAYRHGGFWQCMDTLRDKRQLESLWQTGRARWKVWD
jgi:glucose-1-phosphate cytidylyltransferase